MNRVSRNTSMVTIPNRHIRLSPKFAGQDKAESYDLSSQSSVLLKSLVDQVESAPTGSFMPKQKIYNVVNPSPSTERVVITRNGDNFYVVEHQLTPNHAEIAYLVTVSDAGSNLLYIQQPKEGYKVQKPSITDVSRLGELLDRVKISDSE